MGYSFRVHIKVSGWARLGINESRHELTAAGVTPSVRLATGIGEMSIEKADSLYLVGGSYPSRAAAEEGAVQWRTALQGVFAKLRIGADFGDRVPRAPTQQPAHRMMETDLGVRAFEGHHGTLVFEDEPYPVFITGHVSGYNAPSADQLATAIKGALAAPRTTRLARDEAAYDLLSASFFESNPEARIVLLTSAIEAFHGPYVSGGQTQALVTFVASKLPHQQYGACRRATSSVAATAFAATSCTARRTALIGAE
ncbi:hypothetical protein OG563_36755 [Nocardia vinacea]|uniref:Uncharacterized protein n=1 Tax=Nocardia vinacea TaxID=96468 RepID=A0ABZ1YN58_9NOCA|nr:hypothetical protein [Nocardia vinacea]